MENKINNIGIVGLGLIGGSLAKSFHNLGLKLYACDKDIETLALATSSNIFEGLTDDFEEFLDFNLDLIYLCLPVQTILNFLDILAANEVSIPITDAGSTKSSIQNKAEKLGLNFCGGHPIAGKEVSGFENSDDNLMKGAFHVLTGKNVTLSDELEKIHKSIGMKVIKMDATRHDKVFGLISHMPHLVAYAIIELVCEQDIDALKYTGGGFKDFTRIAASDPKMWADIFTDNKEMML
jgi:prephenate dehydrogenase